MNVPIARNTIGIPCVVWMALLGFGLFFAVPAKGFAQAESAQLERAEQTVVESAPAPKKEQAPAPEFTTWSWPKRIAFVALIMGSIVIVSNTLGKYEWPEEWGGRPKPGGKPIIPEKVAQANAKAKAQKQAQNQAAEEKRKQADFTAEEGL